MPRWRDAGAADRRARHPARLLWFGLLTAVGLGLGLPVPGQDPGAQPRTDPKASAGSQTPTGKEPASRQPATPRQLPQFVRFRAPDGSRFVLVPRPNIGHVHWAVATPADASVDPPGLRGLVHAVQRASLGGTWQIGSRDGDRERATLAELSRTQDELLDNPGNAELAQRLQQLEATLTALGDDQVFARVLAAAPAHDPQIDVRDGVALLQLVTTPWAIGDVGQLLVERREAQALRGLPQHWFAEIGGRMALFGRDPLAALHAELLALAMPGHPETDAAGRPGRSVPRQSQARAVWNATQHPTRTIHVLLGGFDVEATKTVLQSTFAATALPAPPATAAAPPRAPRAIRRSTVPGTGRSILAFAWVLPPIEDPGLLAVTTLWLAGGERSHLATQLRQRGHRNVKVDAVAPWPLVPQGRSLLRIEVELPEPTPGVAEAVLEICRATMEQPPQRAELGRRIRDLRSAHALISAEPRRLTADIARRTLLWPGSKVRLAPTNKPAPKATHALLRAIFENHPVVVEGRP